MTETPWGDSSQLRSRKLAPGYRLPPESVARNQRWRLLAAMVAAVAERGYERTTVGDVVELSGVSRTAFYRHYANKEDCFVAAVDATLGFAMAAVTVAHGGSGAWNERLIAAFEAFVGQVVAQPAAARVCLLEVYVAGQAAIEHADRGAAAFELWIRAGCEQSEEYAGIDPAVVRGVVGGVRKVISKRLRLGEEALLPELAPELAAWALTYKTPSVAIRRPRIRAAVNGAPRFVAHDQVERIFAALAAVVREKGYWAMTLDDVAERAATSFSTFYSHFRTKEEAFMAAYDTGLAQTYAATLPPYQRAPDWPHAIRAALEGFLGYLSRETDWAHAGVVEVLAAGRRGMERRDEAIETFAALLEPGYELAPETPRVASEAIGGAIYDLIYEQIRERGAERLLELLPIATFVALAPFTGVEEAAAVANERPRRRARIDGATQP
ncbi:MAG TPA: helix-turn-helix domain-containing protein [Thermoleophilaceae bacterium]|nr:helix-turn-helix domain-containing protein [Thermoleophilaceae bacterium]